MKPKDERLRYFNHFLKALERGDEESRVAFGRTVHWGYWPAPNRADGTSEDFARAAEVLNRKMTALSQVKSGQRVLDVGCGFGGTIASINDRYGNMELTGVNLDERQLARAASEIKPRGGKRPNRIVWVKADACELPFEDAHFDVVMVVEAIFHFASLRTFFAEARRVLKPGGILVISDFVPSVLALPWLRQWQYWFGPVFEQFYGRTDATTSLSDYRALARRTGFTSMCVEDVTLNTLPSYAFTRRLMWKYNMPLQEALSNDWINRAMEWSSAWGLLRYLLVSFKAI